jgi:MarR family transcriptional regulator, organic hydroperoxide resistance regulator
MEELNKSIQVIRTLRQLLGTLKQTIKHQYRNVNLTGPQGMLIGMLAHYGKMKISDLSEKLDLSNSTVSGILDRLEKTGMIERTRSEEDRRVVYVDVTPEFKKVSEQQFKEIEQKFVEKVSRANPEELDKILEGLNTLKKMLN